MKYGIAIFNKARHEELDVEMNKWLHDAEYSEILQINVNYIPTGIGAGTWIGWIVYEHQ